MISTTSPAKASRSGLLLRDGITFLALCGVTIVLFLVTLFLFRSFEAHREVIGERWAARGAAALQAGRPQEAVGALRTALTYRDTVPERLRLAQALAQAGRTEEAFNYFQTLRETRPGDGFINFQLARLSRQRGDAGEAIDYYRAAILGNWEGDGTVRRREARTELAGYLAQRGQLSAARDELLIASGNTPETAASDVYFADRLQAIGERTGALDLYKKSLALAPHQPETLAKAGRLAYAMGDYGDAFKLLSAALHGKGSDHEAETDEQKQLAALAADAHRVPELSLSRDLPASERADHLLLAAKVAQTRLQQCTVPSTPGSSTAQNTNQSPAIAAGMPNADLQALKVRWGLQGAHLTKRALERDATLEDAVTQLINDTEQGTVAPCGAPQGDDALLLMLATQSRGTR